jgi:hypothetical protein
MLQGAILDDPRLVDEPSPKPSVGGCFTASRSQWGTSAVSGRVSHRHSSEGGTMTYPPSPRTSRDRGLARRWSILSGIPDVYKVQVPPAGARDRLEGDRERPASLLEGREGFEAPIDRGSTSSAHTSVRSPVARMPMMASP